MTPERWQRIESTFHAALEVSASGRAAFLDEACGKDESLRQEVESLLTQAERPGSLSDVCPLDEAVRLLASDQGDSLAGQTIDHYKILARLGAGGMGEVYEATDLRLGRKVALKLLPAFVTSEADQVRRFHEEARAASSLNHPNIITIHELGQADSLHFIAMELVQGETLRNQMRGRMPIREVLNIAIQVASGLSAAHQAGIIHRDIKPENIMSGNDGSVKVLDFGIAKFRKQQVPLANSQTGTASAGNTKASAVAGTLGYMSPEQARGEPLDARSDIFSLGVLLFEMVTGRRPFEGETQTEMLHAILNDEAPPLSAFRQSVPLDLERIIGKALKKNRDERYQSAREMLADLREFNRVTGRAMDATGRANRMLRQYLSIYAVDKRALIPVTKLWFIRRHSDLERGERARELLKRSLRSGLVKAFALMLFLAVAATAAAVALSVSDTWDEVILKDGHTAAARKVAFSPDGRLLVSCGEDSKVIVWDFARRERLATLSDHTDWVVSMAFSPDGKWFATGSYDKSVIVWDARQFEKVAVLQEHRGAVHAVAFSPDGRLLASCSSAPDKRTILWSAGQWEKVREMPAGTGEVGVLLFSADSRRLLIPESPSVWDVATGQPTANTQDLSGPAPRALSPDGTRLVQTDTSGDVSFLDSTRLWDLTQQKVLGDYRVHQDHARAVAFSPNGKLVATGAEDIVLWDMETQTKLVRLEHSAIVWGLAFSPDGRWLVSSHGDGAILVWNVEERERVADFNEHSEPVRAVAFSPDGKQIASASEDRSVIIWGVDNGRKEAVLAGNPRTTATFQEGQGWVTKGGLRSGQNTRLSGVAFFPDQKSLASCDQLGHVIVWDLLSRQPRLIFKRPDSEPGTYCLAVSPDGRWIVVSHGVYESATGRQVIDFFRKGDGGIYGVAFSLDGRLLAVASSDLHHVSLWDTEHWEAIDKVESSNISFIAVSFSPDGKWLVTGDDELAVRLWQVSPLHEVAIIGNHAARVKSVAFSPGGREVASAGDDNAIRLWDVNRRRLITTIGTHTAPVLSVAFSPDGKRLVSGEHDHSVRLYTRHRVLWGHRWD
jgi:WD40 repeat protein/serine/threonine protein kinase